MLDKSFSYEYYEKLDYKKLLAEADVSENDLFLIHYTIIRQRDYFNYTVEGKTYREILEMAKGFEKDGFPVEIKMNDNGQQDLIQIAAAAEGVGFAKKGSNSKRILKTFNFKCSFDNPKKEEVVLLNSSFIVKGPFGDYITTVNYEINCILQGAKSTDASFLVPGKTIQKNLLFEGSPFITQVRIDHLDLLNKLTVHPSGLSTKSEGRYFNDCFFNAARVEPHTIVDYKKDLKDKSWKNKSSDGTYTLDLGNMHRPDETDEVIQMR